MTNTSEGFQIHQTVASNRAGRTVIAPKPWLALHLKAVLNLQTWYFVNAREDQRFLENKKHTSLRVYKIVEERSRRERNKISYFIEFICTIESHPQLCNAPEIDQLKKLQSKLDSNFESQVWLKEIRSHFGALIDKMLSQDKPLQIRRSHTPGFLSLAALLLDVSRPIFIAIQPPKGKFKRVHSLEGFEIQSMPVTQWEWFSVMGYNPSFFSHQIDCPTTHKKIGDFTVCPELPVETFTADLALEFIDTLNLFDPDFSYRLPTPVEFEYAARAGKQSRFAFGDSADELGDHAWYAGNSKMQTQPVGTKKPNQWGLFDMTGLVWNIVESPGLDLVRKVRNGQNLDVPYWKIPVKTMGGSWIELEQAITPSSSSNMGADWTAYDIGLRLVRSKKRL